MPSTWEMYGTDGNKDGRKDPYNPVDAIFAAARYLDAAGYEEDVRRAIFAYNHADWYVDSVMLRARLIAGVPADLVGSLTGLTEGRFPVYARAWYADDLAERSGKVRPAARLRSTWSSPTTRAATSTSSRASGAPVVAVNDGRVEKIGHSERLGHYVRLQDVYGNRYTYAHLGSLAKVHPVPREERDGALPARALRAHGAMTRRPDVARLGRPPGARCGASGQRRSAPAPRCPSRSACSRTRTPRALVPVRRARAAARGARTPQRPLRDLLQLLRPPLRGRPEQGPPRAPAQGLAGDRRHDPRPRRRHRAGQGPARVLLDPAGRPRRAAHRPQADPRRLEAARGHRRLPRLGPQRPPRRAAACRSARC